MCKISIIILILFLILFNLYNKKKENFSNKIIKPNNWNNLGFNDKLIIYGKQLNKNYSIYADKLKLKIVIGKLKIHNLYFPKTLKILKRNDELNLDKLPQDCIIKSNCGSGDIIIIKNKKIQKMISRNKTINNYNEWFDKSIKPLNYKPLIEPHYKYIKSYIFVEEYLGNNVKDFKFFCIHGKVIFCQIDINRFSNHTQSLYDKKFNLLPYNRGYNSINLKIQKPEKYDMMVLISEKIATKIGFDFVRVDLYFINNKIYLGELTFVPGAANESLKIRPNKYDLEIGKLWY